MKSIGIYIIKSPSNKIYIGQSWNIANRFRHYRAMQCIQQPKLYHSLLKHGTDFHKFEIIHKLPPDINQKTMDHYEQCYMDQYRECGVELLNTRWAGSRGKLGPETLIKMSLANKGKKMSDQMKEKTRLRMLGKKICLGYRHTDEAKKKFSDLHKGKKHALGAKHNAEMNNRKRIIATNQSEITKKKISESVKRWWDKKRLNGK